MKNKFQQRGFTLIELLVVIVILGILSTISVGTFRSYFAKARDSERVSTVQNLAMMIKVESGGAGDCGVYNYTTGGNVSSATGAAECTHEGVLETLLSQNDYSMPEEKNGLVYYYGFWLGGTEGDNEFFISVGAEEEAPQNGEEILAASGTFVFLDGTNKGTNAVRHGIVAAITDLPGGCAVSVEGVISCHTDWELWYYDSDNDEWLIVPST